MAAKTGEEKEERHRVGAEVETSALDWGGPHKSTFLGRRRKKKLVEPRKAPKMV